MPSDVVTQLRYYYDAQGWTVPTFAKFTGIEPRRIRSILHAGCTPTMLELATLTQALNCDIVILPRPKPVKMDTLRLKYMR